MQELQFESAWDKTIAPIDREQIIELFEATKNEQLDTVTCKIVRYAFNHNEELLITVLVHNFSEEVLSLKDIGASYYEMEEIVSDHHFTFPHVEIPEKTSMPWTFIFPPSTWKKAPQLQNGTLRLAI